MGDKPTDIPSRIRYLREDLLKIKQGYMSERLHLQRGSLSDIERGKTKTVTDRIIKDICREFNVSEDWLRHGIGNNPFIESDNSILEQLAREYDFNELEIRMIKQYGNLSEEYKNVFRGFMDSLFKQTKETASAHGPSQSYKGLYLVSEAPEEYEEYAVTRSIPLLGKVAGGVPILAVENHSAMIDTSIKADCALELTGDSMEPDYPDGSIIFIKRNTDIQNGDVAVVLILSGSEIAEATCKKVYHENGNVILKSINPAYKDMIVKNTDILLYGKVLRT